MIIKTKVKHALKQFFFRTKEDNRYLNIDEVKTIRKNIEKRDPYLPLSGNYRLENFDLIDVNGLNAEIDLITVDSRTISETISNLYEKTKNMFLFNEITKQIYLNKQKKINKDAILFSSNQFIEGFTKVINIKEDFLLKSSDLDLDDSSIKLNTLEEDKINQPMYREDNVSITVDRYLGALEELEPEIEGIKSDIINGLISSGVYVYVSSLLIEPITVNFRININSPSINNITLYFNDFSQGQLVTIKVSDSGNNVQEVYSQLSKSDTIICNFSSRVVKYVTISLTKTLPTNSVNGIKLYSFNIKKIKFSNTNRSLAGFIISKPLKLEEKSKYLSMVVEESLPEETSIEYLLSYDTDEDNNPINFFNVTPVTREGENKIENFLRLGSRLFSTIIEHNSDNEGVQDWSWVNPTREFGGKLYPIFDLKKLDIYSNANIDESSLKLYRGINDWSVIREKIKRTRRLDKVPYFSTFNTVTEKYNQVPISIKVEEEIEITSNEFWVNYKIIEKLEYSFKNSNFQTINFIINDFGDGIPISGKYKITISNINPNQYGTYLFSYFINIEDIVDKKINIDLVNTRIYSTNKVYVYGLDYLVLQDENNKKIDFIKSGSYNGEKFFIDLIYEEETLKKYNTYKTIALVKNNYTINIGPFDKKEIEQGNFHKINGNDISNVRSFNMVPGTYVIETTQPYSGDFNQFTNELSRAFLDIPIEFIETQGFEDSLRKVPIYDLVLNSGTDDRQFSYENGIVYLNRLPDYVTSISRRSEGKYMKCIRVTDGETLIHLPEKFRLEFNYSDENAAKEIYLTVKLKRNPNTNNTPIVNQIGINEYETDLE